MQITSDVTSSNSLTRFLLSFSKQQNLRFGYLEEIEWQVLGIYEKNEIFAGIFLLIILTLKTGCPQKIYIYIFKK